jgi:hypothetical protein
MNSDSHPPEIPSSAKPSRRARGYFSPRAVRTFAFYTISLCIAASVVACILAIWDFTKKDALWRLVASFAVIGTGTALFTFVNSRFGEEREP